MRTSGMDAAEAANVPPSKSSTVVSTNRTFVDLSKSAKKLDRRLHSSSKCQTALVRNPQPYQEDLAVSFFLKYITRVARSVHSTRGCLEFVGPVLTTQRTGSVLYAAVTAAANRLWRRLRPDSISSSQSIEDVQRALKRLQTATDDPKERGGDATVIAILILQWHDTLTAVHDRHKARGTHRNGAKTLLSRDDNVGDAARHRANLRGNVFHNQVSLCIKQKTALQADDIEWLQTRVMGALPANPASVLDLVGVDVAKLQHGLHRLLMKGMEQETSGLGGLSDMAANAAVHLRAWLEVLPTSWHPRRLHRGIDFNSSIDAYEDASDVYPSIQIANIWNQWYIYSLIVAIVQSQLAKNEASTLQQMENIKKLVYCICCSVPYYVGNPTRPVSYSDIEDGSQIIFPSFHDLQPTDEAYPEYLVSDHYASRVDHDRHVMLQGPLHIMSVLSHVIGMLADGPRSRGAIMLEQGQEEWLQRQLMRSLYLTRIVSLDQSKSGGSPVHGSVCERGGDGKPRATALASWIRQNLWTMNVL